MTTVTDLALALAGGELADPHALLGVHPGGRAGLRIVRAWRPGARSVAVLEEGKRRRPLAAAEPAGLFTGTVAAGEAMPLIQAAYPEGVAEAARDAYTFAPTVGELDLHLIAEGRHRRLTDALGARPLSVDGVSGVGFSVWAPAARSVALIGDHNGWNPTAQPMRSLGASGVWELFVPGLGPGLRYKFAVRGVDGISRDKADPLAGRAETPPHTASIVERSTHEWRDAAWLAARAARQPHRLPLSIYEIHLPSWRRAGDFGEYPLDLPTLTDQLADHVAALGFTHVELLPILGHPFDGSWGYQVTSFFAPSDRQGSPDELRALIDAFHQRGIGVILDWVPGHFPRDDFALARFDGTALYEHADPRRGAHPDWGTLVFNHGRTEVRNFLIASALHWIRDYHIDGLRVDAVASMLYRDYSREGGEWVPNHLGGREDFEAIAFLRELNEVVHEEFPGVIVAAEESTAWPAVTARTDAGGLGFDLKWNMGWMHDSLEYFSRDPIHRRHHHSELTFSLVYAFTEQFILPLSHDEVVHGKGSLVNRMPGDRWQQLANLRCLYGYMWAHPGKKLLFMGGEFAQNDEWSHSRSLDWHLAGFPEHAGVMRLVADLNMAYRAEPALWEVDFSGDGFAWLVLDDDAANVIAFARFSERRDRALVCVCSLSPVPRGGYRVGLPRPGRWREILNTDSAHYGGSDLGSHGAVDAVEIPWAGQPWSAELTLPPLATVWLAPELTAGA